MFAIPMLWFIIFRVLRLPPLRAETSHTQGWITRVMYFLHVSIRNAEG